MEQNQQDVTTGAESSTATLEVPRDPAAYADWRKTGQLPEAKPKEDSTPQKPSAGKPEKTAPASEAGDTQERRRGNAESRLNEILDDLRAAGISPSELRTFKRESKAVQETAAPATTTPAPEKTVNPAGPKAPVKPKESDFDSWEKFEAAKDQYFEDLAEYKADQRFERFQQEQAKAAANQTLHQKMQDAKARYGEDAIPAITSTAKAISGDEGIPQAVKMLLDQSPVMTDVLYVIGSGADREQMLNLMRTDPGAAIRKLVQIEGLVTAELAKSETAKPAKTEETTGRDTSGKFVGKTPPEDKTSKAPPPTSALSGRGTAPPDELEGAVKNGDFRRYREAQNAREAAQRHGR